jgi:acyl transferase domain-containing protein
MSLANLREWASARDSAECYINKLAYTLNSCRSLFPWRCTFVASKNEELLDALDSKLLRATKMANRNHVVFVFTGQGAQWSGMGKELALTSFRFKESLSQSAAVLKRLGASWDLFEELARDDATSRLHESEIGQPATTAIQIGLVELLSSLDITPNAVLGHSSGEIAAAFAAGAITKESAIMISYHRGFLSKRCKHLLKINGAMLAVGVGEEELHSHISRLTAGHVVIACCNSPLSTTVSGDEAGITELKKILERSAISVKRLKVDTAYHSHHMEAVASGYSERLQGLQSKSTQSAVDFYSSVTAQAKISDFGPAYWISNLVSKVRFYDTLKHLCHRLHHEFTSMSAMVCHTFLEIGPHNTLLGPIKQTLTKLKLESFRVNCVSALIRRRDSQLSFLQAIGSSFEHGLPVNLTRANSLDGINRSCSVIADLPSYPWDHSSSYWHEPRMSKEHRLRPHPYHDLLGLRLPGINALEPMWRHVLNVESLPWLLDHIVDKRIVFPASGYIAMAIEAKKQITIDRCAGSTIKNYVLRDVVLSKILEIPEPPKSIEIHLSLRYPDNSTDRSATAWENFRVSSTSLGGMTSEHCHGRIMVEIDAPSILEASSGYDDITAAREFESRIHTFEKTQLTYINPKQMYKDFEARGHLWGPTFALIKKLHATNNQATGTVMIEDVAKSMPGSFAQPHVVHPTTLDALIHSSLFLFGRTCSRNLMFPVGVEEITISAHLAKHPGEELTFLTTINPHDSSSTEVEVLTFQRRTGYDPQLCIQLRHGELRGTAASKALSAGPYVTRDLCYQIDWEVDLDLSSPPKVKAPHMFEPDSNRMPKDDLHVLNRAASELVNSCLSQVARTNVSGKHLTYFNWMLRLQASHQGQQVPRQLSQQELDGLGTHVKSLCVEGEALLRVGSNLTSILNGVCDPLSLLLENGLLSRLYAEDSASRRCCSHLIDYVKGLVFKNPRMRVLEIGAGTAGLTVPLLQALSCEGKLPLEQYDFTDVSPGFFDEARRKLRGWERYLRYETLDIGRDPVTQGFVSDNYDLVLTYNALHVTANVDDAIAYTKKLLKPGGRLVMIEITQLVPYINTIFGVLPGWYLGERTAALTLRLHLIAQHL